MSERWLVIGHEATNSGAPRMLLQVLQGVRAARGATWSCEIVLRYGGVLVPEFARMGPVHVLAPPWAEGHSLRSRVLRKLFNRPSIQARQVSRKMKRWDRSSFDIVYNNTATNGPVIPAVRRLGFPIVTHVHELGAAMRRFNTPAELAQTITNTDQFIAVSPPVECDLIELGVPAERIAVVPNFLPSLPPEHPSSSRAVLRRQLELPLDASVVIGCGHIDRVKGPDLFVEAAAALGGRSGRPLCFAWLGGVIDARFARQVQRLVRQRGLQDVARFVGPVDDPSSWFAASDIVAVTSRAESFSLVALEAAAQGRPVVGFSGARGLVSVLGRDSNLLVPGHDPAAMAVRIAELLEAPKRADNIGRHLRAKVAAEFLAGARIETILSLSDKLRGGRE